MPCRPTVALSLLMDKIVLIHALDGTGPQDGVNVETDVYHGNAIKMMTDGTRARRRINENGRSDEHYK